LPEPLLREGFDSQSKKASKLENTSISGDVGLWGQEVSTFAHDYRGVISVMMSAIEDLGSALYVSCYALHEAGTELLAGA